MVSLSGGDAIRILDTVMRSENWHCLPESANGNDVTRRRVASSGLRSEVKGESQGPSIQGVCSRKIHRKSMANYCPPVKQVHLSNHGREVPREKRTRLQTTYEFSHHFLYPHWNRKTWRAGNSREPCRCSSTRHSLDSCVGNHIGNLSLSISKLTG